VRLHRPLADRVRARVVAATNGLFAHGPYPLAETLRFRGDPGLFGPGSMTWQVIGDSAVFIGGLRALLVQAAHPEVVAGVAEHSRYRHDPLGRLSRTAAYVTATTFGAGPEVDHALGLVRGRHRRVVGVSHRGIPYDADAPDLAAWVHNSLAESFLVAYRAFGPRSRRCSRDDADRYVAEQARLGSAHGAVPLPSTAAELSSWIASHPALAPSPGQREAVAFLRHPPLPWTVRVVYGFLFRAAVATVPPRIRETLGVRTWPGAVWAGRCVTAGLRWALGSSPSWQLALLRTGAAPPSGVRFRQRIPTDRVPLAAPRRGCGSSPTP